MEQRERLEGICVSRTTKGPGWALVQDIKSGGKGGGIRRGTEKVGIFGVGAAGILETIQGKSAYENAGLSQMMKKSAPCPFASHA